MPSDGLFADKDDKKDNVAEFTVSELSFAVKRTVERGFEHVRVRGELGRISQPASGHIYLDLKDDKAVLNGVIWKGNANRLKIRPEQGMEVIVTGKLTTFPGQSRYQIVIDHMEPAGVGALMALLEKLKEKLADEGLFDEERKKPRPFLPRTIGIVTSPTGAVIRDMMHGFTERFPSHVIIWPVRVQGETSGREVAAAIRGFNALKEGGPVPRPDVLIVARGGGSLEDLWGFNEEIVARAAADSTIPLISAVGHETDWSVLDLVADFRAPTPTKAAEWAVPKQSELIERLGEMGHRLTLANRRALEARRNKLLAASRGLPRLSDLLALPRQRVDEMSRRLSGSLLALVREKRSRLARLHLSSQMLVMRQRQGRERLHMLEARRQRALTTILERKRAALSGQTKLLNSLSHKSVLERGFALVRDENGAMMRKVGDITPDQLIHIEMIDGQITSRVEGTSTKPTTPPKKKTASAPEKPVKKPVKNKSFDRGGQGSLF
ncbi:MAG: exodeoxyribonuclease VII large subunit [Hyphomicrobiaceae bacterium]|nr:exodeoxyribonuclease VII large subunit [Hyphomicrobiaceae bacterium]